MRIKVFLGTTENAVTTQIWIAVCTYMLIIIAQKCLHLPHSHYEILQILSLTMFKTTPINQLFTPPSISSFNNSSSSEKRWDTTDVRSLKIFQSPVSRRATDSAVRQYCPNHDWPSPEITTLPRSTGVADLANSARTAAS